MPKDWGGKPSCAPRTDRLPEESRGVPADDGICPDCDSTGETHGQICKGCGGKGYVSI